MTKERLAKWAMEKGYPDQWRYLKNGKASRLAISLEQIFSDVEMPFQIANEEDIGRGDEWFEIADRGLVCPLCDGSMEATEEEVDNSTADAVGCLILIIGAFFVGFGIFAMLTVVGILVGIISFLFGCGIFFFAQFLGSDSKKVWKCQDCGHYLDRI